VLFDGGSVLVPLGEATVTRRGVLMERTVTVTGEHRGLFV
jgi:hypothetical protein